MQDTHVSVYLLHCFTIRLQFISLEAVSFISTSVELTHTERQFHSHLCPEGLTCCLPDLYILLLKTVKTFFFITAFSKSKMPFVKKITLMSRQNQAKLDLMLRIYVSRNVCQLINI